MRWLGRSAWRSAISVQVVLLRIVAWRLAAMADEAPACGLGLVHVGQVPGVRPAAACAPVVLPVQLADAHPVKLSLCHPHHVESIPQ